LEQSAETIDGVSKVRGVFDRAAVLRAVESVNDAPPEV
jgi:hypothetical protein